MPKSKLNAEESLEGLNGVKSMYKLSLTTLTRVDIAKFPTIQSSKVNCSSKYAVSVGTSNPMKD